MKNNTNQDKENYEKPLFVAWGCPICGAHNFAVYSASQKDIDEHMATHKAKETREGWKE